jgi:Transcriptional regulator
MAEPGGSRRGRVHDAEKARVVILNAVKVMFAEHGFAGARVDAIAEEADYNKSLIFQYFGDKLSLYVEVLKRVDREMNELQARVLGSFFADETIVSNESGEALCE